MVDSRLGNAVGLAQRTPGEPVRHPSSRLGRMRSWPRKRRADITLRPCGRQRVARHRGRGAFVVTPTLPGDFMSTTLRPQGDVAVTPPAPFSRILCAVDGSPYAVEAVAQTLVLAGADTDVTFLTVTGASGSEPAPLSWGGRCSADEALEQAQCVAYDAGISS